MLEAKNLHFVDGPLVRQKLKVLRDEETPTPEFRQAMKELSLIMVAEAAGVMPTNAARIRTPLAETEVEEISRPVCLVPVLRAGLGMLEAALALLPEATVGFMGLQRDDVTFYVAAVDPELDENAFIVPGLGDAGDRLYGTL